MEFKKGDRVRIVDISLKSDFYHDRQALIGAEAVIVSVYSYDYAKIYLEAGYLIAELAFTKPLDLRIHGKRESIGIFGVKLEHVSTYTPEQLAEWDAYDMEVES